MRDAIKVKMPIWTTFNLLMGVLVVIQVQCFQEGICPQKDVPHGVRVLAPGSEVTLHCSGQITVDGRVLTREGDGRGTSNNPRRTSRAGDSARPAEEYGGQQPDVAESEGLDRASYMGETVNLTSEDTGSMLGRGLNGSQAEGGQSFIGGAVEKANTSSFDRVYDEALGAAERVVRGLRERVQWRVDGHRRTRGGDGGDVLQLSPLHLNDSGVYSCHRGGKKSSPSGSLLRALQSSPLSPATGRHPSAILAVIGWPINLSPQPLSATLFSRRGCTASCRR
ncbi:hypothetical protein AAFF_G00363240 [Aldrovandia affinis]|uniref:Uncharacterized protein n=1 Tax=Aldrovandia affinis TaxID=143900 RepID=A0AAD7VZ50_9TELE|nr:hypothetical protein AAFF_G00363240 [Aldrovandia affinis]